MASAGQYRRDRRAFWWAQLAAWWMLSLIAWLLLAFDPELISLGAVGRASYAGAWGFAGILLALTSWWLATNIGMLRRSSLLVAAYVMVLSLVGSLAWAAVVAGLHAELVPGATDDVDTPDETFALVLLQGLILLSWHAFAIAGHHVQHARTLRERALAADSLARRAQLEALAAKLQPHWLFNALNTVVVLIDEKPAHAQRLLVDLSHLLRRLLHDSRTLVALGEELDAIRVVLDLAAARYEDRLRVVIDVPAELHDVMLPSLVLQPLVENALKHAWQGDPSEVEVRLCVRRESRGLLARVSNTGCLPSPRPVPSSGFGLRSVEERMAAEYEGAATFRLEQADGWVHAELRWPG